MIIILFVRCLRLRYELITFDEFDEVGEVEIGGLLFMCRFLFARHVLNGFATLCQVKMILPEKSLFGVRCEKVSGSES